MGGGTGLPGLPQVLGCVIRSLCTYNLALFILSFVSLGKQHPNGSLRRRTCTHGSGLPVPTSPGHSEAFCIYTHEDKPWETDLRVICCE